MQNMAVNTAVVIKIALGSMVKNMFLVKSTNEISNKIIAVNFEKNIPAPIPMARATKPTIMVFQGKPYYDTCMTNLKIRF